MLAYYSEPEQKDDNRYNCAVALALLKPKFSAILETDLKGYLGLMGTLVKLLIDEIAPIRKKVCKIVYSEQAGEGVQNDNIGLHKALDQIFSAVAGCTKYSQETNTEKLAEVSAIVQNFICELVCDPISEKYKRMAFYDSRIFNFDKPNKYKEELKVMRAVLANLAKLPKWCTLTQANYNAYTTSKQIKGAEDYTGEVQAYVEDPYKRNEFIFGIVIYKIFQLKTLGTNLHDVLTKHEKAFWHYLE